MTTLSPPNSWAERIVQKLINSMPDEGEYTFLGSCVTLGADGLQEMIDSDEWEDVHSPTPALFLNEVREKCAGLELWEDVLGYAEDTIQLENDWHIDYGKGIYKGLPCYWIRHSHIEYVWVKRPVVETGRMSVSSANLSSMPKCKHGNAGPCMDCRMDPAEMKVIPYAILATELDQWGCPYCGYAEGHIGVNTKNGMPASAEGTFVRYCNSCRKFAYALAPGVERSAIPFGGVEEGTNPFYPRRTSHPRRGLRPHLDKMDQGEGQSSEVSG